MLHFSFKMLHFSFKMFPFSFKMVRFSFKIVHFSFKMANFGFKCIILASKCILLASKCFIFKMVICGLEMANLSFQRVPGQDLAENGPFAFKPHKEFIKKSTAFVLEKFTSKTVKLLQNNIFNGKMDNFSFKMRNFRFKMVRGAMFQNGPPKGPKHAFFKGLRSKP